MGQVCRVATAHAPLHFLATRSGEADDSFFTALRGQSFGKHEVSEGGGAESDAAGGVSGGLEANFAEEAAEGGADDEAEAEGHADEAEVFGAVLRRGDVGDGGHGGGDVAASGAVDNAGKEHDPERAGPAKEEVTEGAAEDGEDEDGTAADAVTEGAKDGSGDELGDGEGDGEHADGEGVGAELADQIGHYRDEDAGAEEVQEDG